MKCPKSPNCCIVSPHAFCVSGDGAADVTRQVTCKQCLNAERTNREYCSVCDAILPWPDEVAKCSD